MGKKSKIKQIRRLASQMPDLQLNVIKGGVVKGSELIKQGIKEVEGKPVEPHTNYRKKEVVQQPLNHHRQMKRLYNKMGESGVGAYINEVNRFVSNQQAKMQKAQ